MLLLKQMVSPVTFSPRFLYVDHSTTHSAGCNHGSVLKYHPRGENLSVPYLSFADDSATSSPLITLEVMFYSTYMLISGQR